MFIGVDGVSHAEELFYEWIPGALSDKDMLFSKRLLTMWTNFIKYL